MKHDTWLVTLRVSSSEPVEGRHVQEWAQEQAKFLSGQDTLAVSTAGEVRWDVAAISAQGRMTETEMCLLGAIEILDRISKQDSFKAIEYHTRLQRYRDAITGAHPDLKNDPYWKRFL